VRSSRTDRRSVALADRLRSGGGNALAQARRSPEVRRESFSTPTSDSRVTMLRKNGTQDDLQKEWDWAFLIANNGQVLTHSPGT
jgi:hypothetical protein